MISLLQLLVLAVVQGLTEFLPVSSSAHLILTSHFMQWPDQGLVLDVACHLGTLISVLFHFRKEVLSFNPTSKAELAQGHHILYFLAVATLPLLVIGFLSADWIESNLRQTTVIAWATLIFALLLGWADFKPKTHQKLNYKHAILIGLAQCFALIPGASRAGVSLTAGLALGLGRVEATRFAMLLSIPATGLAGGYGILKIAQSQTPIYWDQFLISVLLSAITGYIGLRLILNWAEKASMMPFVIYRVLLAGLLFLL